MVDMGEDEAGGEGVRLEEEEVEEEAETGRAIGVKGVRTKPCGAAGRRRMSILQRQESWWMQEWRGR